MVRSAPGSACHHARSRSRSAKSRSAMISGQEPARPSAAMRSSSAFLSTSARKLQNTWPQASRPDCDACALKPKCCPNMPFRRIARDVNKAARDVAPALAKTEAFERSRRRRKCCLLISSASCGLRGFGCAAHAVRKMSLLSPQSRRTYAGLRSWLLDHHQRPMHVLRSQCRVSEHFDAASPLPKERIVRAVPTNRGSNLAATVADFCNKICHDRTHALQQTTGRGLYDGYLTRTTHELTTGIDLRN